eukprot:1160727-Pelagomonas_calceolata.AAC.30
MQTRLPDMGGTRVELFHVGHSCFAPSWLEEGVEAMPMGLVEHKGPKGNKGQRLGHRRMRLSQSRCFNCGQKLGRRGQCLANHHASVVVSEGVQGPASVHGCKGQRATRAEGWVTGGCGSASNSQCFNCGEEGCVQARFAQAAEVCRVLPGAQAA